MIPHKCPVCLGTTNVPGGFYQCCPGGYPTSAAATEQCQACVNGVVWEQDPVIISAGVSTGGGQNATFQWHQSEEAEIDTALTLIKSLGEIKTLCEKILKALKGQERHV